MYKIMLADNEGIALDALKVVIDQAFGTTCDIRLAQSSHQVMDIFQKYQPDILLINAQMPGIHGIYSIRELHALNKSCLFLVVSHKMRLNYQREGDYMGVIEYLTKPITREKMVQSLTAAIHRIDHLRTQEQRTQENKEKMEAVIPIIEHGFMSLLLYSDQPTEDFLSYRNLLNIRTDYGWILVLEFCEAMEHGSMQNCIGSMVQLEQQHTFFRRIIRAFFPAAIVGPMLANRCAILFPCNETPPSEEDAKALQDRLQHMISQLSRRLNLYFRAGIGEIHSLGNMRESLEEAKKHLSAV